VPELAGELLADADAVARATAAPPGRWPCMVDDVRWRRLGLRQRLMAAAFVAKTC
jgi:hypothetical protein